MDGHAAIDSVRDDLAIRDLIARIALLGDAAHADDHDDFVNCFDEQFSWSIPGASGGGHAGIVANLENGAEGRDSHTRHVITTQSVELDGGDTARSNACFLLYGESATKPTLLMIGVYHDEVRRTPSGWKLVRRDVTFG